MDFILSVDVAQEAGGGCRQTTGLEFVPHPRSVHGQHTGLIHEPML